MNVFDQASFYYLNGVQKVVTKFRYSHSDYQLGRVDATW